MESHLIYSVSSHLKNTVNWTEWVYCGVGNDLNEDVIYKAINEYFEDSMLYFVITRKESSEVNKQEIIKRIKKELPDNDLLIWDANYKKTIGFNKIGVMRYGVVSTHI